MYCTKCGARLNDGAQFCHVCGTKRDVESQDKVAEVATPETKGEFDGVSWDSEAPARPPVPQPQPGPQSQPKSRSGQQSQSKAPARSKAAPKPAARTSKKAEKQPRKKRGFFFWVLVFIGVMLLVFVGRILFDYIRIILL